MSQKNLLLFHLGNPLDEVITAFLEGSDTDIHFARDKQHAIELLKVHDIGVVCCTASGPGSPGFDFLRYMMRQFPLVQRVYMSDHFTVEEMELAVNKAHINYYIHLPAEQEKFAKIIHKAFKRFRAVSRPGEKLSQLADITIELMTDV
jgi:DNA-binding NtrC family response regulator